LETPRLHEPGVAELLREFFREAGAYMRDLALLFASELKEKSTYLKSAIISFVVAAFLGVFAFLFLSVALVAAIAYGLGSWGWAFLIVGVAYAVIGGLISLPAAKSLKRANFSFEKTSSRLREDSDYFKHKLAA
jgi:ABC-type multidrug transport system permease subunit